jgi:glycerol-3-phosphate acyltransferase PlsY
MQAFLVLLAGQLGGYLAGGIPFAYLITRWKTGRDIRAVGSGNVGATNVGRLLGLQYFILVFVLDFAKGVLPVLLARCLSQSVPLAGASYLPEVVGFAAILGHVFPIYLGMRGGKGVSTTIGVLVSLVPWETLAGLLAFLVVTAMTRWVSAGSIAFVAMLAGVYFARSSAPWNHENIALSAIVLFIAALVIIKHRSNIARILSGTEPRVRMPWEPRPAGDADKAGDR